MLLQLRFDIYFEWKNIYLRSLILLVLSDWFNQQTFMAMVVAYTWELVICQV